MVMKGSIICGNCQGIRVRIFDKRKPENTTGIIKGLGERSQ